MIHTATTPMFTLAPVYVAPKDLDPNFKPPMPGFQAPPEEGTTAETMSKGAMMAAVAVVALAVVAALYLTRKPKRGRR